MKTILHIGMAKTGSTALQNCLRASAGALAAKGVLYPANPPGCPFNNHRLLLFGFLGYADLPRHVRRHALYTPENLGEKYAEFRAVLGDEVAAARPRCVILSSETLFRRLGPAARASLGAALAAIGAEPRVAAYLRRPSDYYLSALQQHLKSAHKVPPPRPKAVCGVLESYAETFGAAALAPRIYDRGLLAEGDIVADFLAAHLPETGLDPAALTRPQAEANVSISGEAMALMRRYRFDFHREEENVASREGAGLLRALRAADRTVGPRRPRLRPEVAAAIDYGGGDPLRLRDRWGLVFPGLDYARLERRGRRPWDGLGAVLRGALRPWRLEEVVALDAERQRALVEALGRSRWARGAEARASWVAGLRAEAAAA